MCCRVRFVNFEPACSLANQRFQLSIISNQRVRFSISNQYVISSIGTFLKTSNQIEQIHDETQRGLSVSTSKECGAHGPPFLTYFYFNLSGNQRV